MTATILIFFGFLQKVSNEKQRITKDHLKQMNITVTLLITKQN